MYVNFVIEKDGTVSNVKIARGVDQLLDAEAMRIIRSIPKWTPGYQHDTPVRSSYTVPVNFTLATSTLTTKKNK